MHYSTQYSSLQAAIASNQPQAVAVVAVLLVVQNSSPKNLTALINAMNTTSGPMNSVYPYDLSLSLSCFLSFNELTIGLGTGR